MTAIIFGVNGQDGFYLSKLLEGQGLSVIGVSRATGDLTNYEWIRKFIRHHQPQYIFHLAAISTTRHEALFDNHAIISTGTLNILEAVKTCSAHTKVFISGSGLQFENKVKPIRETDPFEARDAYSVSRIQSAYAARYYHSIGIQTYVGYFFNHESPRRTEQHVSKMIANKVKAIAKGKESSMEIGDLSVIKEWTFAGDIVEAIWTLVQQDLYFEAVIGSGVGHSIGEYIESCFRFINKNWKDHVELKPGFKSEYRSLVSDPLVIFSLGWRPRMDLQALVKLMLTE